jgi:hypothetical protein
MKARHLLNGLIVAAGCFGAGLFANQLPLAQDKPPASHWKYKAVDLQLELVLKDGKLPDNPFAALGDIPKRLESLLAKHGEGGWELVSYSGGTAIYKQPAH